MEKILNKLIHSVKSLLILLCALTSMVIAEDVVLPDKEAVPTSELPEAFVDGAPEAIDTIVVTATRSRLTEEKTPMALSVLSESDFDVPNQGLGLDEWLMQVPGLFFENRYNFAQNLRVSTRGFGARAPFGVRGIRLITDGFPDTLPDGQAQVDGIDLLSLRSAEVIRGPSSVLYGNASGGVISLATEDGEGQPGLVKTQLDAGADGFRRINVQAGKDVGLWHGWVSASDLSYQGQRRHAGTDKRLLNAHGVVRLSETQKLKAVVGLLDQPLGQDPGALTLDQIKEDRWQASAQSESLNAGQSVEQARIGLQYEEDLAQGHTISAHIFRLNRDFEQQLPSSFFPSLINYERIFSGAGVSVATPSEDPWGWVAGIEWARQADDRQRFLVDRQGQVVSQTQDELQVAQIYAAFLQTHWVAGPWSAMFGLRRDNLRLSINDAQSTAPFQSKRTFSPWSLMGGLTYEIWPGLSGFVSLGEGFESPSFTEIKDLSGGGGFTRSLGPARALNAEVGVRAKWSSGELSANLFWIDTKDEIVVVGAFEGVDIFDNAGRTDREGFEFSLRQDLGSRLKWQMAYTYAGYRFDEFVVSGDVFNGNRLPGLPKHVVVSSLDFAISDRWSIWMDGSMVGGRFADNANEDYVAGHELVNIKLRYRQADPKSHGLEWVMGINNLFNQTHFSNIRINANRKAYYEPGPARAWFVGLGWSF